jgi:hypothetical protein
MSTDPRADARARAAMECLGLDMAVVIATTVKSIAALQRLSAAVECAKLDAAEMDPRFGDGDVRP